MAIHSGPIRRALTRLYDSANALLFAREMWIGLPAALAILTAILVAVRGWYQVQVPIVQFTSAASAFLFLAVGMTGLTKTLVRAWRTLDVVVSVRRVELHPSNDDHYRFFIGLNDVTITSREHRGLSVELFATWRFENGREKREPSPGFGRKHWILNGQQPTLNEDDVRFFLHYSDAAYENPALKADEKSEALNAKAFLVVADLISGKERRIPLVTGEQVHDE